MWCASIIKFIFNLFLHFVLLSLCYELYTPSENHVHSKHLTQYMVSTSFYHAKLKATNQETNQISFEKTLNPRYEYKVIDNCALSNISSMNAYMLSCCEFQIIVTPCQCNWFMKCFSILWSSTQTCHHP